MITASEVCEYECLVTRFVFSIVDILGLAAQSGFSLHRVYTSSQISCLFYFPHLRYFATHEHTLGNLEVIPSGRAAEMSGRMQVGTEASRYSVGSGRKRYVVRTDDAGLSGVRSR